VLDNLPTRRTDAMLYKLLAECRAICEFVEANQLHDELRHAVKDKGLIRPEQNRSYVERKSSTGILVARYVLTGVDNRNSVYRYGKVLTRAMQRTNFLQPL